MSDGQNDAYQREQLELKRARQKKQKEVIKVLDDLKWMIAEEIVDRLEDR